MTKLSPGAAREALLQHIQTVPREQLAAEVRKYWGQDHPTAKDDIASWLSQEVSPLNEPGLHGEINDELRLALGRLDPLSRQVISLRMEESLTCDQIAERLGIRRSQAARRMARGLSRLLQHVTPCLLRARDGKS